MVLPVALILKNSPELFLSLRVTPRAINRSQPWEGHDANTFGKDELVRWTGGALRKGIP